MAFSVQEHVEHLNSTCFNGSLNYEKVAEVAGNVPDEMVQKLFKDLEEKKDSLKDPTAWITTAFRRAYSGDRGSGGRSGGGGGGGGGNMPADIQDADKKLRKRIGWLNGAGGFDGAIVYDKVMEASGGLPYSEVMKVLKSMEEKKAAGQEIKDANAYVCSGLRKAGGGGHAQAQAAAWGPPQPAWGAPQAAAWAPPPGDYGFAPMSSADPAFTSKVQKRVEWLNTQGGFGGALLPEKVAQAAAGVNLQQAFAVLKDVEEKREQVKDPNAYVCAALRKMGGGKRGGGGGGGGDWAMSAMSDAGAWGGPPQGKGGYGGGGYGGGADMTVQSEDAKLRKRIGWMNGQGGFNGSLIYDKIMDAAAGLEFSAVFTKLKDLEEKKEGVNDPTAWVCSGLRKMAAGGGGGGGGPPPQMQQMMYGGGAPQYYGGGMDFGGAMEVDTSKIRKKINWLNGKGGFNDQVIFDKIMEASGGLDTDSVMRVLKDMEEKKDNVKNPTSYATSAMRKMGGGGKGGGKSTNMHGVKKTILKTKQ